MLTGLNPSGNSYSRTSSVKHRGCAAPLYLGVPDSDGGFFCIARESVLSLPVNGSGWGVMRIFNWVACRFKCGALCRFVVAARSFIRPCSLFIFRVWGLYGLLIKFGQ